MDGGHCLTDCALFFFNRGVETRCFCCWCRRNNDMASVACSCVDAFYGSPSAAAAIVRAHRPVPAESMLKLFIRGNSGCDTIWFGYAS